MYIIGHSRYTREAYPPNIAALGAATAAMRNRNIFPATGLSQPFTPSTSASPIAAIVFTPRVSGVLQVAASIVMQNGANPETYEMGLLVFPGTGISVTGGEVTINGWVAGSNTPPIVAIVPGAPILTIADLVPLTPDVQGALAAFGITTPPQPLGVPLLVVVELGEVTGPANPLAQIAIANLSIMELP